MYALAFIQLYFVEHPYKVASYWIFDNVPPGSRLVGPHWDDKVPVGVPGKNPSVYVMEGRDNELPVYERDTPQMIDLLARRISAADYLMFPTPRTPDSIPRIPEEYPNTTALLRLLWGEKLGFTLLKTFKNRPSFLGITFNDDLADESFSVYDHPKVTIFQNTERLSKEEILRRIAEVKKHEPLPSMNEMLLMDTGGWRATPRWWSPEKTQLLVALAIVQLIGLGGWLMFGRAMRWLPDGGLGASALIGVVVASAASWLLAVVEVVPLTRAGAWFVVAVIALSALARVALRSTPRQYACAMLARHGVPVVASFCAGAALVWFIRFSDPAFSGPGERVDIAYLNYLTQSTDPLPGDIVRSGQPLPLVLWDRFVMSWVLKLFGVSGSVGLEVAFLAGGGIIGGVLYSLCVAVLRRPRPALIAVAIAFVPTAYIGYTLRDSVNRSMLGADDAALMQPGPVSQELVTWVRENLHGAPCIVVACEDDAPQRISLGMGLPLCVGGAQAGAGSGPDSLCTLDDPQLLYLGMMEQKFELYVLPSQGVGEGAPTSGRVTTLEGRRDLFSKVFDDGAFAVFAASFSSYARGSLRQAEHS
jgi:hypothetical protein